MDYNKRLASSLLLQQQNHTFELFFLYEKTVEGKLGD